MYTLTVAFQAKITLRRAHWRWFVKHALHEMIILLRTHQITNHKGNICTISKSSTIDNGLIGAKSKRLTKCFSFICTDSITTHCAPLAIYKYFYSSFMNGWPSNQTNVFCTVVIFEYVTWDLSYSTNLFRTYFNNIRHIATYIRH